jgi:hypothetical protein
VLLRYFLLVGVPALLIYLGFRLVRAVERGRDSSLTAAARLDAARIEARLQLLEDSVRQIREELDGRGDQR